jgi:hypothetical protein
MYPMLGEVFGFVVFTNVVFDYKTISKLAFAGMTSR